MIDLTLFCAKASESYPAPDLTRPASVGDWTYATDRRIAIRVPRRADIAERKGFAHQSAFFESAARDVRHELHRCVLPVVARHRQCGCEQTGESKHDCVGKCDGKLLYQHQPYPVGLPGGFRVCGVYLRRIFEHVPGNIVLCTPAHCYGVSEPVLFEVGDAEIVLMSLSHDKLRPALSIVGRNALKGAA